MENYNPIDAVDYILNHAKEKQILILNEAHHKPLHRIFAKNLLGGLKKQGYKYLALESLPNFDEFVNALDSIGHVKSKKKLGYLLEPQMASLIREAISLRYKLIAYERNIRGGNREEEQAKNIIINILEKDPHAKILIFCGYCHLLESEGTEANNCGKTKWMAKYLKELSRIDPFTIDQEIMTEREAQKENPYYSFLNKIDVPSIWKKSNGKTFKANIPFGIDLIVVHPRTKYIYGRPSYLFNQPERKTYFIKETNFINLTFPCLVEARFVKEGEDAVPVDIFETNSINEVKALILPKGAFNITIKDSNRKKKKFQIIIND